MVTGKTPIFLFALTLASEVLYEIINQSNFQSINLFNEKVFVFQKICIKAKVVKTLKISSDCHVKTDWFLKRWAIFENS